MLSPLKGIKITKHGIVRAGRTITPAPSIAARQQMVASRTTEHVALRAKTATVLREARAGGLTPKRLAALRRAGADLGWAEEALMVRLTGRGSRAWTAEEMSELLRNGKVVGYSPHHINSVAPYEWMAGNAKNIQIVERWTEHGIVHGGNTQLPTEGSLINRSRFIVQALTER